MLNIIGFVISFVALVFFIFSVRFMIKEGKDDRGYRILGEAGMSAVVAFLFGYSVTFTINTLNPLSGTQYTFALTCLLAFVLLTYSGSIIKVNINIHSKRWIITIVLFPKANKPCGSTKFGHVNH